MCAWVLCCACVCVCVCHWLQSTLYCFMAAGIQMMSTCPCTKDTFYLLFSALCYKNLYTCRQEAVLCALSWSKRRWCLFVLMSVCVALRVPSHPLIACAHPSTRLDLFNYLPSVQIAATDCACLHNLCPACPSAGRTPLGHRPVPWVGLARGHHLGRLLVSRSLSGCH